MSYEGFEQCLCANGHLTQYDAHEYINDSIVKCSICGADLVWSNSVDQTNCCGYPSDHLACPDYDGTCEGVGMGYVKLEVKEEVVFEECTHCHARKLIKERTYKIPKNKE